MKKKQKTIDDFPMEKLRDYTPQTKTILKVEDKQRAKYFFLGGISVAVIYFILVWLMK